MELSLKLIILDKMKVFYYYFQYIKNNNKNSESAKIIK